MARLRDEVDVLKSTKLELEKTSHSLTKENNASGDRNFALLTEKYELITKYDLLGASVKDLKIKNCGLKAALSASKDKLTAKEGA